MRSAVFLPIPFALDMKAVSLDAIALASSSTVLTDKSASDALAPTPFIFMSKLKKLSVLKSSNPYKLISSSLTISSV